MAKMRAVVVDDDNLSHLVYSRIFKTNDVGVKFCSQHSQCPCKKPGLETCPVEKPCVDLLLTEYWTPGMSGLDFLLWLKQMDCKIPDTHKAIISANWPDVELKKAKQFMENVFHKFESTEQISRWVGEVKRSYDQS